MEENFKIVLPKEFSKQLLKLPEQGMGYQVVDILLKNGKWLKKKYVVESHILILDKTEEISANEIDLIKLHFT